MPLSMGGCLLINHHSNKMKPHSFSLIIGYTGDSEYNKSEQMARYFDTKKEGQGKGTDKRQRKEPNLLQP